MVAKIAGAVVLVLLAAATHSNHVVAVRDSSGFGGTWTSHSAPRPIERFVDPVTTDRLREVPCAGVPRGTATCFVAASR
jgi:hypothetical protein